MKIRNGFVSNSSSSSFIIKKSEITPAQLEMIKNHIQIAKKINEAVGETRKGGWSSELGNRRLGAYRYFPKTAEEIEQEKKEQKQCNHPEVVECENCNPTIDPEKEVWDDNIIVGSYYAEDNDAWEITETETEISGYCSMNNFDMEIYLKEIGIPDSVVNMEGD